MGRRLCTVLLMLTLHHSSTLTYSHPQDNTERDGEASKKIIGSSVVTSVSVILNGNEPQFTDAVGKPIPKPMVPLQVASPINLLNPDRYEFYTFDDNGELVKRLMTLKEIQSIVANGDGDGAAIIHNIPVNDRDPEKNVQDIVASVQNVLTKEVEWKRNASNDSPILDTPDVSSSWSMILPAIFGNTGGEIFPHQKPQQVVMTPDSDVVENSTKASQSKLKNQPKPNKTKLPPRKRPTATKKPTTTTTITTPPDYPQKIFVNNEEIIKPIFNRFETTISSNASPDEITSTSQKPAAESTTTKTTTTTKRIATKVKPTSYYAASTKEPARITTTTSSTTAKTTTTPTVPSTTKLTTTTKMTTTPSASTASITTPTTTTTTTTSTTTRTTASPTTPSSTSVRPTATSSKGTSTTSTTSMRTPITPSQINETANINAPVKTNFPKQKPPTEEDETTTLSISNILSSLSQDEEDLNTKLSFDQILESLKDNVQHQDVDENFEATNKNQTTIQPVQYSKVEILTSENFRRPPTTTEKSEVMETTLLTMSSEDSDEDYTTTEGGMENLINNSTDNELDGSKVVKYEPLYVEIKDPILTDIATTTDSITTDMPTTEPMDDEDDSEAGTYPTQIANEDVEIKHLLPPGIKGQIDDVKNSSDLAQTVDNFIAANINTSETVSVNPSAYHLAMGGLPSGSMNMSEFKEQAATVASMLEGSNSVITEIPTEIDNSEEIESLLSDVLNQITDSPATIAPMNVKQEIVEPGETSNRLSNIAQINAGFIPPPIEITPHLHANDKFDKFESMALEADKITSKNISKLSYNTTRETSTVAVNTKEPQTQKPVGYAPLGALLLSTKFNATSTTPIPSTPTTTKKPVLEHMEISSPAEFADEQPTTEMDLDNDEKDEDDSSTLLENIASNPTTAATYDDEPTEAQTTESEFDSDDDDDDDDERYTLVSTTLKSRDKEDIEMEKFLAGQKQKIDDGKDETSSTSASNLSEADDITVTSMYDDSLSSAQNEPIPSEEGFNITENENAYVKLGESGQKGEDLGQTTMPSIMEDETTATLLTTTVSNPPKFNPSTLKPVHYYKQPSLVDHKYIQFNNQRPVLRPPSLSNLKINQISQVTRAPVKLDPTPEQGMGLEASTMDLQEDIQEFARLCNELAFSYWKSITSEKISPARSLILSPFALTSMLSMVFLGARGGTSGEMNEVLKLDDMVTFNPHLVFKNITESVERASDSDIASSAFVREIFSDRANGKILQFFKEKTQQLYSGHVEEVNFNVVNDIIRRRTNLLIKRHTMGKVMEYLRTNSVWVNGPLATVSANLFQTDCSRGSTHERDGEMFFQVHPSIRQRRLVPIPAVVYRAGFTAGYDPELDATVVAFGSTYETVSTIYLMPGQQGLAAPGDNLERLEKNLVDTGITQNSWSRLLTSLMERPGLEVQLPRFSHRSFINASMALQKMGLKALFNSDNADLRGLTGSSNKDVYLSDMVQINTFSTCAEEKITDHHHVEMYPAPPLRRRNAVIDDQLLDDPDNIQQADFGSIVQDSARGFYDDLLDPKYLELPLPLRPRQARIPDAPRLRFDKPFLFFVRHNPTGMILFMGRFNPRLLP